MSLATPAPRTTLAQQVHAAALDVERRRVMRALGQQAAGIPGMADQVRAIAADAAARARRAVAPPRNRPLVIRAAALRCQLLALLAGSDGMESSQLHAALIASPACAALLPITVDNVRRCAQDMAARGWVASKAPERPAKKLPRGFSGGLVHRITEPGAAALQALRETVPAAPAATSTPTTGDH